MMVKIYGSLWLYLAFFLLINSCVNNVKNTPNNTKIEFERISSDEQCEEHLKAGNPGQYDQLLCRSGFTVGYDYPTKLAKWVIYHVTQSSVQETTPRSNHFREDEEVQESLRSTLSDYYQSGYDRGHLAPRATVDFDQTSMNESFLLTNISPQLPGFNREGWASLESYIRDCAVSRGELYIATGPMYNNKSYQLLNNNIAIPDAYYKVIFDPSGSGQGFAFRIPHQAIDKEELEDFVTSIDAIEIMTGLDFFSAINDQDEQNPVILQGEGKMINGVNIFKEGLYVANLSKLSKKSH